MIVQCEQCMAKYRLQESRIPGERAKVKCSRCQHIFLFSKEKPSQQEPSIQLSLEEGPDKSVQAPFQCPQCGFQQPHSQECIKCGIIFSKYKPRDEITPPSYSQNAPEFGLEKNFLNDGVETTPMTYAGFWSRFGAHLIDGVIAGVIVKVSMYLIMFPISYYLSRNYMSGNPQLGMVASSLPIVLAITMIVGISAQSLYFIIMWGRRGATLGKMAMRIKIVSTDGSDISYGAAFLRYIGTIISGFLFGLGYLWMLWDDKNQTWHDKIASTCVIRTQ